MSDRFLFRDTVTFLGFIFLWIILGGFFAHLFSNFFNIPMNPGHAVPPSSIEMIHEAAPVILGGATSGVIVLGLTYILFKRGEGE